MDDIARDGPASYIHSEPEWRDQLFFRQAATATTRRRRPRIERMNECDEALRSCALTSLRSVLLKSSVIVNATSCMTLRPLWAEEAMHRSYNMIMLTNLIGHRSRANNTAAIARHLEFALARDIARCYDSLVTAPERKMVSCSPVIRELLVGLVTLFEPAVGVIKLATDIERISLMGFQRRALILIASELVINALLHAFLASRRGRLLVKLQSVGTERARLSVSDDGVGCKGISAAPLCGVTGGLASLLGSNVTYREPGDSGTLAEVTFFRMS